MSAQLSKHSKFTLRGCCEWYIGHLAELRLSAVLVPLTPWEGLQGDRSSQFVCDGGFSHYMGLSVLKARQFPGKAGWLDTLNLGQEVKRAFHDSTMFSGTLVKQLFRKLNTQP